MIVKQHIKGEVGFWVYVFNDGVAVDVGPGYWAWRTSAYPRAVRLCFVF